MNLGSFLLIKAIIAFVFALAYLLLPATAGSWFNLQFDAAGLLVTRLLGVTMLGIGLVCWFTRGARDSELRRGVLLSYFLSDALGFLVTLQGQLALGMGLMGWLGVLIWLFLTLGLGYFRFVKQ